MQGRRKQALVYIENFLGENDTMPSLAEIAKGIGLSPKSKSTAKRYVSDLLQAGYLSKSAGARRGIRRTQKPLGQHITLPDNMTIPLLGKIAAGKPIEAIYDTDTLNLSDLFQGPALFALKVIGDSMIEEGIVDGDWVVCERRDYANDGEIVVALIDGTDVTLKRIKRLPPDQISLRPANSAMQAMVYAASRISIQGVLKCQLRPY